MNFNKVNIVDISEFKQFVNKPVQVTTIKNSIYKGVITPVYKKNNQYKVTLNSVIICNKDGNYKAMGSKIANNARIFNCESIKQINHIDKDQD